LLNPIKILHKDRFTAKYSPSVSWTAAIFNYERWTRGARTQLQFTARDYEFTTSRDEWNAVSPLVNSWSQVHEFTSSMERSIIWAPDRICIFQRKILFSIPVDGK